MTYMKITASCPKRAKEWLNVCSGEHVFIKTQDGTKMYSRMIKVAENYFPLMTKLLLKLHLTLLSSPYQEACASSSFFYNAK